MFKYPLSFLRKLHWPLILVAFFLTATGMVRLFSLFDTGPAFFYRQLSFWCLGILAMVVFSFIDFRILKEKPWIILSFYILFLIAIGGLFVGGTKIKGATKWYRLGEFSFDPVQFLKLILILVFAKCFAKRYTSCGFGVLKALFYFVIPVVFILLQPDFGSVLVLAGILLGMVFIFGVSKKQIFLFLLVALVVFVVIWNSILLPYQKQRIFSFINPEADPQGQGYSLRQSLIAIGSGGFKGQGMFSGQQSQLGFLPEAETDFIIAAYAEEWGFLGLFIVCLLWGGLVYNLTRIAVFSKGRFGFYLSLGVALWVFSQGALNIAAVLGLFPVVGVSFPFVSYGGSSLISLYAGLGLAQSVWIRS